MQRREHRIQMDGDREMVACSSLAKRKSNTWLVFLPESGSEFLIADRRQLAALVGAKAAQLLNFLVVNKTGLSPTGADREVFENSFRRLRRIDDALCALKTVIPRGDRIHLLGYSEGAYLAPQVASRDKRIRSVSMIGGGTRGWLKEELANAKGSQKTRYQKKISEILRHPSPHLKWNGFSYATWYSYRGDHTLRSLRNVRVPTLAILGARDRVIDLKTTIVDLMLVSRHQPIQVHIFGDCGHHFSRHWREVSQILGRFLADQLAH